MKQHNFKKTNKKHPKMTDNHILWRCDQCDSEAIFTKKFNARDVNQLMSKRFACLPPIGENDYTN